MQYNDVINRELLDYYTSLLRKKFKFDKLFVTDLSATKADIATLDVNDSLTVNNLNVEEELANRITVNYLKANYIDANEINAKYATLKELTTEYLKANEIEASYATIAQLSANYITASAIAAKYATLESLQSDYIKANEIEAAYAKITELQANYLRTDAANIKTGVIDELLATSSILINAVIRDGKITGELSGVTINGDLINANTLKAKALMIEGKDGLYYRLNTDGETISSEQTTENALDGSHIIAKSILADKINVSDLQAFDATIGGFIIDEHAIRSSLKKYYNDAAEGLYLGTSLMEEGLCDEEGFILIDENGDTIGTNEETVNTFGLGSSEGPHIFFGDGKLDVKASSFTLHTGQTIEEYVGNTVIASKTIYYHSTSSTTLEGGEWSETPPDWDSTKYIWQKTLFEYKNGSSSESNPVCISGKNGQVFNNMVLNGSLVDGTSNFQNGKLTNINGLICIKPDNVAKDLVTNELITIRPGERYLIELIFAHRNTQQNPVCTVMFYDENDTLIGTGDIFDGQQNKVTINDSTTYNYVLEGSPTGVQFLNTSQSKTCIMAGTKKIRFSFTSRSGDEWGVHRITMTSLAESATLGVRNENLINDTRTLPINEDDAGTPWYSEYTGFNKEIINLADIDEDVSFIELPANQYIQPPARKKASQGWYTFSFYCRGNPGDRLSFSGILNTEDPYHSDKEDAIVELLDTEIHRISLTTYLASDIENLMWCSVSNYSSTTQGSVFVGGFKMERGVYPTDWYDSMLDIDEALQDSVAEVQTSVNDLEERVQDRIVKSAKDFEEALADEAYQRQLENGLIQKDIQSQSDDIGALAAAQANAQEALDEANSAISQMFPLYDDYFEYGPNGLLIGSKSGISTNIQLLIRNDRISFIDNGSEVAYVSNKKLYIMSGVFYYDLKITRDDTHKMLHIVPRTNGSFDIKITNKEK